MKMTFDDQYLVTVAEDASVLVWKVQDKEGRGLKRDKEVGYAVEILITKSDLEEKVGHCITRQISTVGNLYNMVSLKHRWVSARKT